MCGLFNVKRHLLTITVKLQETRPTFYRAYFSCFFFFVVVVIFLVLLCGGSNATNHLASLDCNPLIDGENLLPRMGA